MPYDCRLFPPFNMLVAGPSKSGKTTFVSDLLKVSEEMFAVKPDYVILYYSSDQPIYRELTSLGLINEMVNFNNIDSNNAEEVRSKVESYQNGNGSLIIFDDTLSNIKSGFEKIFQEVGHHSKCSLIYITQNLFSNRGPFRDISLQMDYIAVMKNSRNISQIKYLANQLCIGSPELVIKAYLDITQDPFSYALLDCSNKRTPELSIRSRIFPGEEPYTVHIEK